MLHHACHPVDDKVEPNGIGAADHMEEMLLHQLLALLPRLLQVDDVPLAGRRALILSHYFPPFGLRTDSALAGE